MAVSALEDGIVAAPAAETWHARFDAALARTMAHRLGGAAPIRVLEAGGGSRSYVRLNHPLHVTTIDISPEQIARNTTSDVAVVGDLATYDFGPARFDIVMCWNVLEHVHDAAEAVAHLVGTLEQGGVLVVRGPDPRSMKGVVTALTPHRVHVLFHRHVLDRPNAGQPGFAPFPTHMEADAGPDLLARAFAAAGLEVAHQERFVNDHVHRLRRKYPPLYFGYAAVAGLVRLVTLGRYGSTLSDFVMIARKPA